MTSVGGSESTFGNDGRQGHAIDELHHEVRALLSTLTVTVAKSWTVTMFGC